MATTKITTNSLADSAVTSANLANSISIGTLTVTGNLTVDTNTFFVDAANNRVGIGTVTPASKLSIGSGQIELPLGTVGAPSYTFNGDLDTGLYSASANTINFATGGVLRLTIQSGGNVALPASAYLIANNIVDFSTNTNGITMDGTKVSLVAGSAARLTAVIATGNIGIGTTTPSAKLHTIATTEQLRLGYDASNYTSTTVSSAGLVTLNAVGASARFAFANTTRPTSAGTTATLAAADASSLITKGDGDSRFGAIGLANTSAISINSQITPQTIRSTALAVGVYHVRMVFLLTGTANTGTRHGYAFSGTSTIRFFCSRASSATYIQVTTVPFDQGLAEESTSAVIEGIISVTVAGTFSMQAAQNTSHVDTLTVAASNYMLITPCPNGSIS
jgi:hypothetical protein